VREKLTACKNHRITNVVLPFSNKKNFDQLPVEFKNGFTVYFVKNIEEVYAVCFEDDEEKLSHVEKVQFDDDNSLDIILNTENISEQNSLEEILNSS
jgi:predicted ATP-dependent protease